MVFSGRHLSLSVCIRNETNYCRFVICSELLQLHLRSRQSLSIKKLFYLYSEVAQGTITTYNSFIKFYITHIIQ